MPVGFVGLPVLWWRALANLLDNAGKYTDDPARPITLTALSAEDRLVIEVRV